jgi:predicted ATPase
MVEWQFDIFLRAVAKECWMINGCWFNYDYLNFHTEDIIPEMNIFTIVVGRNGSGKSRLLRGVVNAFASVPELKIERDIFNNDDEEVRFTSTDYDFIPTKVIASSTSPFDKFPVDRRGQRAGYYEYLGLKGLQSSNLSLAFMAKTIGSLVRSINSDNVHSGTIVGVLDYLGYYGVIKARFAMEPTPKRIEEALNSPDPIEELLDLLRSRYGVTYSNFLKMQGSHNAEDYNYEVLKALHQFLMFGNKPRLDIVIDFDGVRDARTGAMIDDYFTVLLEAGFLRLRDITLHKKGVLEPFRMSDASSGEQCVVMAILGIASQIKDGSLVCIDEPEVCLHPEWQERYIELLISTFSRFSGCHFVIATHSPQIVSMLGDENCYILDIQKRETYNAKWFNKKSADFQLASVFGAPGYKNEYLSREFISALATLGSGNELSQKRLNILHRLLALREGIDDSDPVRRLMDMLLEALEEV